MPATPKSLRRAVAVSMLPVIMLAGCAGAPKDSSASSSVSASQSNAGPLTITPCGQKVTLDKPATRAVTLHPGATQDVLALGGESKP
ncbi:ABC transporter substrate-binding protein, partial [Clostridioides difficile]|nr:ABC transporter substrate-binding protein [Clostridioides difficile]